MKEESPYKEDWTHDIHDRLADFETDAPDGLWEAISSRLDATSADDADTAAADDMQPVPAAAPSRTIRLTLRRAIAAAAAVALILSAATFMMRHGDPTESLRRAVSTPDSILAEAGNAADTDAATQDNPDGSGNRPATQQTGPEPRLAVNTVPSKPKSQEQTSGNIIPTVRDNTAATDDTPRDIEDNKAADRNTETAGEVKDDNKVRDNNDTGVGKKQGIETPATREPSRDRHTGDLMADARPRRRSHTMTFGAYASGGATAYAAHGRANGASASIMAINDANWEDSPLLGMLLYNRGQDTQTRVRHHQPIRAGVSFTYMINDRFGIESGVTYTLLSSDMRDGSDRHFYDGRQRLHYLGIPLNVKYDIVRWRGFGLYGSAGLLAEQCIAGRMRKEYVLDGSSYRTINEKIGSHPFQLSANISAGVRYDFTRTVGIYAEPGLSYYFDDGTTLETIYKQRPLNFNLNVGVRFTVGR